MAEISVLVPPDPNSLSYVVPLRHVRPDVQRSGTVISSPRQCGLRLFRSLDLPLTPAQRPHLVEWAYFLLLGPEHSPIALPAQAETELSVWPQE